jgi:probable phosphoglycerate mutase
MSKPARNSSRATEPPPDPGPSAGTTIVFVRHGVTPTTGKLLPGRAPGLHLSERGQAQATAVADHLESLRQDGKPLVAAVYASPLERTMETAAPIAAAFDLDVRAEPDLAEVDMGAWTGMELTAAFELPEWKQVQRHPTGFRFPGGESFVEMQTRMLGIVERLRAGHPGETVVAVSHADPIRALVAHFLGTHLDLFQRIIVSPCSLTAVAIGDAGPMVLAVNSTDLSNAVKA